MTFDQPRVCSCLSPSSCWERLQHFLTGAKHHFALEGWLELTHHQQTVVKISQCRNMVSVAPVSSGGPLESRGCTGWLISPHQHLFTASSHSASEWSGIASWWSNHNPTVTDSEAHSQERFKAVKMSAWLKAQFEHFIAAHQEPAALQTLPKDITHSS